MKITESINVLIPLIETDKTLTESDIMGTLVSIIKQDLYSTKEKDEYFKEVGGDAKVVKIDISVEHTVSLREGA